MSNTPIIKATTADTATSTTNAAAVITYAAAPGFQHGVHSLIVSYAGGTASGSVKIENGSGVTVFFVDIPAAGVYVIPLPNPLVGSKNTAMIITLAAGGSGVVGKLNIQHDLH